MTDDSDENHRDRIRNIVEESDGPFDTGKTRNPERIEPICEALEQRWKEASDMRLGQLVSVLTGHGDTFTVEDTTVMDALDVEIDGEFWADKEEQ